MKIFFLILSLLCLSSAFGASSGSLLLKGVVPKVFSLAVSPESIATGLPLNVTQRNTLVAKVVVKSNSTSGYKITINSANAGKLVHQNVGTSTLPYTLKYRGRTVNLASAQSLSFGRTRPVNRNDRVAISYTGVPYENLVQGDYSDTVTFTISSI